MLTWLAHTVEGFWSSEAYIMSNPRNSKVTEQQYTLTGKFAREGVVLLEMGLSRVDACSERYEV